MLRFKGLLSVCVFICFLFVSGVSIAEEAKAVPVDKFQEQINSLNDQVKAQNKNSEKLKKTVIDQQEQIKSLKKNLNRVYKQTLEDTGQIEVQQVNRGIRLELSNAPGSAFVDVSRNSRARR